MSFYDVVGIVKEAVVEILVTLFIEKLFINIFDCLTYERITQNVLWICKRTVECYCNRF